MNPLIEKFKNYQIILASNSPRRQELLKGLDLDFTIETKDVNEDYNSDLKGKEITEYLAYKKAQAFGELTTNEVVITADTIVWFKNKALEKPKNTIEAIKMLQELSGNIHKVITSVSIKTSLKSKIFTTTTKVHFKKLSTQEIAYYVNNYKPFDKAGSYGIQEWFGYVAVEKIEGSYFNVMGLPVHKLYEELLKI
ncbi:Maf family nucleotide pyrophosphatase [Lutibacter sp. TH_r2]|uniref:Maf family nucleotide pyrophosphatase n=1 Tax=Lutibacter sp. TH_r2 TaxID=3082083 RepID=UPI002954FFED|nr:Maf family nucleotide pyrophosphatase [Lutibacter sp. TH_r2]MDV7188256.1 Maf family nucleotide pyrophosphatase [Lutibacter sp. TH_r2]